MASMTLTAVQICLPSERFQEVLNIAAATYHSSQYPVLRKVPAVSFRNLMEKNEREMRRLSRGGSRRSRSGESSSEFSDGAESTSSSSSAASTAMKEWNFVREMAGKMRGESDSGGMLCGLTRAQRRMSLCPSGLNLRFWAVLVPEGAGGGPGGRGKARRREEEVGEVGELQG